MDQMPAHTWPISTLSVSGSYLLSGDQKGEIKVRDCANSFNTILEGSIPEDLAGNKPEVTSVTLFQNPQGGAPIVVAGDKAGQLTLLTYDQ